MRALCVGVAIALTEPRFNKKRFGARYQALSVPCRAVSAISVVSSALQPSRVPAFEQGLEGAWPAGDVSELKRCNVGCGLRSGARAALQALWPLGWSYIPDSSGAQGDPDPSQWHRGPLRQSCASLGPEQPAHVPHKAGPGVGRGRLGRARATGSEESVRKSPAPRPSRECETPAQAATNRCEEEPIGDRAGSSPFVRPGSDRRARAIGATRRSGPNRRIHRRRAAPARRNRAAPAGRPTGSPPPPGSPSRARRWTLLWATTPWARRALLRGGWPRLNNTWAC